MLAWTRRQIERGCLNSKSPSKSFLEFSRSVYEQEVGKGKGLKPMESFSLQTLTMSPQGCSKYSRWGKLSKKGHKRSTEGKKRDMATNLHRHRHCSSWGGMTLCAHQTRWQQFQKNFLILLFYCCFLIGLVFYSKPIVSIDLKLFKFGLNQGYYNFQTQVCRLKRKVCRPEGTFLLCSCRQLQTAWHNLT